MDDIDRPGESLQIRTSQSPPIMDKSNRPPVADNETEEFDEVDRPSVEISRKVEEEEKQSTETVDLAGMKRPGGPLQDSSPVVEKNDDINMSQDDDEEEMLPSIMNSAFDATEYVVIKTPEDLTDAPIGGTSKTDGPFSGSLTNLFSKSQQPSNKQPVQMRSQRVDKEGITTTHTTYTPKEIDSVDSKTSTKGAHNPSDSFYDMNQFPRGKLTLINVKHFKRSSGMSQYPREGTDRDADGLTKLFLDLGFIVERFDNPSRNEIMAIMKQAANEDYSDKSCCACAMLSHGEEGIIYGTDDYVKIKDITKLFRSRSLAGKPKFFLFQACQGSEYMDPLDSVDGPPKRGMTDEDLALTLPSESDFLYAYSTVPGYYSWRNSRRGSWFMEAVVEVFRQNAHKMDVLRMFLRVNNIISSRKSRTDDYKTDDKRQIASIVTQMRKDFFLCPPYGPLPKKT